MKANYDEHVKKDIKYHRTVWRVLIGVAIVALAFTIALSVQEYDYMHNGTAIECKFYQNFDENKAYATYSEGGKYYSYDLKDLYVVYEGDRVMMYYKDNIYNAIPQTPLVVWIVCYAVSIGLLAVSIWRHHVVTHPVIHAVYKQDE